MSSHKIPYISKIQEMPNVFQSINDSVALHFLFIFIYALPIQGHVKSVLPSFVVRHYGKDVGHPLSP